MQHFRRILIPTDGSEPAKAGVLQGLRIAKVLGATPYVIVAVDDNLIWQDDMEVKDEEAAEAILQDVEEAAEALNIEIESNAIKGDSEKVIFTLVAEEEDIDLVCLGAKCRADPEDVILGTLAEKLIKNLSIPVIVQNYCGKDFLKKFDHLKDSLGIRSRHKIELLVAVDDSEQSRAVAFMAVELANQMNVRCKGTVLTVAESGKPEDHMHIVNYARNLGVEFGVVMDPVVEIHDDPAEKIIQKAAELRVDLIVMGTHGRGRVLENIMGSVAKSVTFSVGVPVVIIPPMVQKGIKEFLDFEKALPKLDTKIPHDEERLKVIRIG